MKTIKVLSIFFIISMCFSCSKEQELTLEEASLELNQMYYKIEGMSASVECTDASEWTFTSYGSKPCGGPWGFVAYSKKIDTTLFLLLVDVHRAAEKAYNNKWDGVSDCSVPPQPKGIKCVNEKPVFVY